jgi:hypothetical protein
MVEETRIVGIEGKLCCVVEKCRYPQTCEWNQRCMESEMKKSMDAKMESGMDNNPANEGISKKGS